MKVKSFVEATGAVPVENTLFSTDDVVMWGVHRSSLKPELLTDSSGAPQ